MSGKRRDSKGRVLKTGEVQKKDGRYMFRYSCPDGTRKSVYSWKLVETDKVPDGKKCTEALRTMEKDILRNIDDGIMDSGRKTVDALFDDYISLRSDLRESTRTNYKCMYDLHVRDAFGSRRIDSIKHSDVYKFYMHLNSDHNLKVSTIQKINAFFSQMFELAVKDRLLKTNPASDAMVKVLRATNDEPRKRHAMTISQQTALLEFVYGDSHYKRYGALITTLLGTGLRIGEALGLRWDDVDFERAVITVSHSLSYRSGYNGKCKYYLLPPKTRAGIRTIPMFDDVCSALKSILDNREEYAMPFEIDGYSDFVFVNSNGKPYEPGFIHRVLQNIVADYNKKELASAISESREPVYMPSISPHILRHTFCTRLCENESNLKVIQDVMGHKTIRTTMDVYSEATEQAKKLSFSHLEGKIRIR